MQALSNTNPGFWSCLLIVFAISAGVRAADWEGKEKPQLHCVVTPSAVVDVASGVGGRVETVDVERGDRIEAGQLVATLESGVEKANLALAQARAELEAEIHLREARLSFQQRSRARTERLHSNRVVSAHEQDEAKTDAVLAGWQLRQAIDNQRLARLELNRAKEVVKRRLVHSPIAGVVVERFKWPGEYVEEEPIARVARLDPLWVEVVMPVALRGTVSRNMLAEITTAGDGRHQARVIVIDPIADAGSGTFLVRLELPNPDGSILGGVKCSAHFPEQARFAPESPGETDPLRRPREVTPSNTRDNPAPQLSMSAHLEQEVEAIAGADVNVGQAAARGYIVLTPKADDQADRRELVTALRAAGIDDFLEMGAGPYAGRISLGTYNGPVMAERRRARLAALGFEAIVVSRDGTIAEAKELSRRVMGPEDGAAQGYVAVGSIE